MSDCDLSRVIAAEGVSNVGSILSRLVMPWVATLTLDAGPAAMAVLLVTDVAVLTFVAVAVWQGRTSMVLLTCAAALGGLLTVAFEPARSAWMAQCAAVNELAHRNAQLSMVGSVAESAAFAAGGWLCQALGAVLALAIDALSYLGRAWLLRGVREAPVVGVPAPCARRRLILQSWRASMPDCAASDISPPCSGPPWAACWARWCRRVVSRSCRRWCSG